LGSSSYLTNLDGEVVQHIEYVPFGEVFLEEKNAKWNTPYLFTSMELDKETGWNYFHARYQDPKLGIFLSVDPMAENNPWFTPYHYASNNPINRTDPTGMLDDWYENNETKEITWFEGSGEKEGYKHIGSSAFQDNGNGTTTIYNDGGSKDTAINLRGVTLDKHTRWEGTYFDRSNYGKGENPYSPYTPDGYAITVYGSIDYNFTTYSMSNSLVLDGNTNQLAGFSTTGVGVSTTLGFSWNFGVSVEILDKYDAPDNTNKQVLFDRLLDYSKGGGATYSNWGVTHSQSAIYDEKTNQLKNAPSGVISNGIQYNAIPGAGASYGVTKTNRLF
jgi:RHS repeat-associated protein